MSDFNGLMQQANLIGGAWTGADSGKTIAVTNPATGEILGQVPDSGEAETERAIAAAKEAFKSWSRTNLSARVKLLQDLHDALLDNQEPLAQLLTAEQGKPLFEARGEIAIGAAYVRWFAEEIRRAKGEIVPSPTTDRRLLVTHHPIGVVGAITPWNFPSSMLARKLAPALAAGCTVVAKPATDDALFRPRLGQALRRRRLSRRRGQHPHRLGARHRRRDHGEPGRAQGDLHRLDRGGQDADPPVGRHGEEGVDGAWRQRALHRLRRRRSRRGDRGRDDRQVPQHGPDLRLHQPVHRPGRHPRRLRRSAWPRRPARWSSATAPRRACSRGR